MAYGMESSATVDRLVIEDHNKVRALFSEFKTISSQGVQDHGRMQQIAWEVIRLLSIHSIKEEEVLYPAVKKAFGDEEYKHLLAEHMELKKVLSDLDSMKVDRDPVGFTRQMEKAEQVFLQHIKEEEEVELPKLLAAPGIDALELGQKFQKAEAHAPTRPHTMAPDKAPINVVTNMMTAPLDAARDAMRFGTGAHAS